MTATRKKTKLTYWISTGVLAAFILPGIFYLNSQMALEGTMLLGFPRWFHYELGIGKFIGGLILILPFFPKRIKEWAYVAFGIDAISAFIGILVVVGTKGMWYAPLIFFIILVISYLSFHKLQDKNS